MSNPIQSPALQNDLKCILAMDRPHVTKHDPKPRTKHVKIYYFCVQDKCYTYTVKKIRDSDLAAVKNLIKINKETRIKLP